MKLRELEAQLPYLARELFNLKRCFGSQATIGIVLGPGCKTGYYRTLRELEDAGHIPPGYGHLDRYLAAVPSVYECTTEELEIVPSRYIDEPECPWVIARRKQELARARVARKRELARLHT